MMLVAHPHSNVSSSSVKHSFNHSIIIIPPANPLLPSPTPLPIDTLLPQHPRTPHKQRPDIPAQEPHIPRLHRRHTHQILRVSQMRVQLRQLRV